MESDDANRPEKNRAYSKRSPENIDTTRLYVDAKKSEYINVDTALAAKVNDLLDSQTAVVSGDDVEDLLSTSDKIAGANCHKTSLYLTGIISKEELFAPGNDDPVTAGHEHVESHSTLYPRSETLEVSLGRKKFPFRVSFFKKRNGKDFAYHSITVLGLTNKGRVVAFEKEGPYADTPFRYVDGIRAIAGHITTGYTPGLEK
jgi:hypothetical protein